MTRQIPAFIESMLAAPPRAGEGVHSWLYRVSRQLHAHLPAGEIVNLLQSRIANCGRNVTRHEIEDAVKNSMACAWQPSGRFTPPIPAVSKWPDVDQKRRASIIGKGYGLPDLWELSNPRMEDNDQHSEEIIDMLFPGNPLLCCGASSTDFFTCPREEWRGELAALQLIVPSPMTTPMGLTKAGKESAHTLSNTDQRRFLICEFDTGSIDQHAGLLLYLADFAPLVCAVHSGGKSLHGWFYVDGQPEAKVEKFFRYAVSLGADRATWTRSQFVRMPDGTRDNGRRQTVFFLNVNPLEGHHD
jgi:hypothetical protein